MSVNKFIGIGNLCADPEIRYSPSGTAVCNVSIACNETYKDKSGNKQESTEFVRLVAFGRTAEIFGEYTKKGQQIYIEGKLQTRAWEDKEGIKRYTTEVIVQNMQMLGRKDNSENENRN